MFDKFRRKENNDDDKQEKRNKRSVFILLGIAVISVIYTLIQYIIGSETEKAELVNYVRNNFHISSVDLTIFTVCLVIFIILKIKERKK